MHLLDFELPSVGFVVISRERMAASRSAIAVDAPAMGSPPAIDILVVVDAEGFGVELRDTGLDLGLDFEGPSPIKYPAETCCFGAGPDAGAGLGVFDLEISLLVGALGFWGM